MKTIFYNHMQVFTYIVGHLYHAKQTYLMYFHIEVKALKKKGGAPFTSIQVFTPNELKLELPSAPLVWKYRIDI